MEQDDVRPLADWIKEKGMGQRAFAEAAGVSWQTVYRALGGSIGRPAALTPATIKKLARALDVRLSRISEWRAIMGEE